MKTVYFTVKGKKASVVVSNDDLDTFLSGLLKKVYTTVKTADCSVNTTPETKPIVIRKAWVHKINHETAVVSAKVILKQKITVITHKNTFDYIGANKLCAAIRKAGTVNLVHWR